MNSERQKELTRTDLKNQAFHEHHEAKGWTQLTTGAGLVGTGLFAAGQEATAVGFLCIAGATAIPAVLAEYKQENILKLRV